MLYRSRFIHLLLALQMAGNHTDGGCEVTISIHHPQYREPLAARQREAFILRVQRSYVTSRTLGRTIDACRLQTQLIGYRC